MPFLGLTVTVTLHEPALKPFSAVPEKLSAVPETLQYLAWLDATFSETLDGEWEPRSVGVLEYTGAPANNPELEEMVLGILDEFGSSGATKKEIHEALVEKGVSNVTPTYIYRTILAPLQKREILRNTGNTNRLKWHRA